MTERKLPTPPLDITNEPSGIPTSFGDVPTTEELLKRAMGDVTGGATRAALGQLATIEAAKMAAGGFFTGGSAMDAALGKTGGIAEAFRRERELVESAMSPFAKLGRQSGAIGKAADGMQDLLGGGSRSSLGSSALESAKREIERTSFGGMLSGKAGATGSLSKAIEGMHGMKGLDTAKFKELATGAAAFEEASASIREQLAGGNAPNAIDHDRIFVPSLPPLPENPIHKTNRLLDDMTHELAEQRAFMQAAAEAQQREAELITKLVEAFTANQIASDKAAKRSQRQAWLAMFLTVLAIIVAIIIG